MQCGWDIFIRVIQFPQNQMKGVFFYLFRWLLHYSMGWSWIDDAHFMYLLLIRYRGDPNLQVQKALFQFPSTDKTSWAGPPPTGAGPTDCWIGGRQAGRNRGSRIGRQTGRNTLCNERISDKVGWQDHGVDRMNLRQAGWWKRYIQHILTGRVRSFSRKAASYWVYVSVVLKMSYLQASFIFFSSIQLVDCIVWPQLSLNFEFTNM